MKKHIQWFVLVGAVSVTIIALADAAPSGKEPAANGDVRALQNEVTDLRARVQKLEDRTKELESAVKTLTAPRLVPISPQPTSPLWFKSPSPDSVPPKIWGEKKVNGWTVYIVPCEQKSPLTK